MGAVLADPASLLQGRLICHGPGQYSDAYETGDKHIYFTYDYMGRRVRKRVETYNGSWPETSDELFVYDGWNVVMVLNANAGNAITRDFTWGLDLSGTIHGAGGIGGLLAVEETQGTYQGTYWFFYDGNGNVGQLVKTVKDGQGNITGVESTLAAHYEYDPYGNVISSSGAYRDANPFRFSTKWFDAETHLGYWGYRYYSPRLGRWLNRDPIGEEGGLSLYEFASNVPVLLVDPWGLRTVSATTTFYWGDAARQAWVGGPTQPTMTDWLDSTVEYIWKAEWWVQASWTLQANDAAEKDGSLLFKADFALVTGPDVAVRGRNARPAWIDRRGPLVLWKPKGERARVENLRTKESEGHCVQCYATAASANVEVIAAEEKVPDPLVWALKAAIASFRPPPALWHGVINPLLSRKPSTSAAEVTFIFVLCADGKRGTAVFPLPEPTWGSLRARPLADRRNPFQQWSGKYLWERYLGASWIHSDVGGDRRVFGDATMWESYDE